MDIKFLFDLGGVFFDWDPKYFYKDVFKNKKTREYFLNNICNDKWNIKQDKGRLIVDAEKELINKHPEYKIEIKMYYKNHRKMIKKTFANSINALMFLKKKKYKCYVLSNWSNQTFKGMKTDYPFLNKFDGFIISGKEKMIKPNKNIYKLAIKRFNLKPKHTIFIDDKIENINSANKLGFKTIHLQNPRIIKKLILSTLNK